MDSKQLAAIALSLTEQVNIAGKDARQVAVVQNFLQSIVQGSLVVSSVEKPAT